MNTQTGFTTVPYCSVLFCTVPARENSERTVLLFHETRYRVYVNDELFYCSKKSVKGISATLDDKSVAILPLLFSWNSRTVKTTLRECGTVQNSTEQYGTVA